MRTPTLAVATVVALGLTLVIAAPLAASDLGNHSSAIHSYANENAAPGTPSTSKFHPHIGIVEHREATPDHAPFLGTHSRIGPRASGEPLTLGAPDRDYIPSAASNAREVNVAGSVAENSKRTTDDMTLGGNAVTGNSSHANGGNVVNYGDNFGMPTLLDMNSNNAGHGGQSLAGCAIGGHGNQRGAGGNAQGGNSGDAVGGGVWNSGAVVNMDSNNAGAAGTSMSGCATGGSVSDAIPNSTPSA